MMRLHREQERERESAGLKSYAAEVARNPPTMSAESRAMSMAAAAAASSTPGCRHMAAKIMVKCMAAKVPARAAPASVAKRQAMGVKVVAAQWKGKCPACKHPVLPGASICRSEDLKGWVHVACRGTQPVASAAPAAPAAAPAAPAAPAAAPAADRQPTTLRERREVVRQRKLDDPYYSDSDPESDGYSIAISDEESDPEESDPEWCMGEGFDEELYDWEDRHLFNQ